LFNNDDLLLGQGRGLRWCEKEKILVNVAVPLGGMIRQIMECMMVFKIFLSAQRAFAGIDTVRMIG